MMKRKCLFLDRDGVINKDISYAHIPGHIEFVAGIFHLCRYFQNKGFLIVIITNQSGIARNYYSEKDFQNLSQWMRQQFQRRRIKISAIYHCPHHPNITGNCFCRKPQPGMFLKAIKDFNIDPKKSYMIGDKDSDMQAALSASIKNRILINDDLIHFKRSFLSTARVNYHQQLLRSLRRKIL